VVIRVMHSEEGKEERNNSSISINE